VSQELLNVAYIGALIEQPDAEYIPASVAIPAFYTGSFAYTIEALSRIADRSRELSHTVPEKAVGRFMRQHVESIETMCAQPHIHTLSGLLSPREESLAGVEIDVAAGETNDIRNAQSATKQGEKKGASTFACASDHARISMRHPIASSKQARLRLL